MEATAEHVLLSEKSGALARMTLNRPKALNALNDAMRASVLDALPELAGDPEIYALVLQANGTRAFCAGGDVRELMRLAAEDVRMARASVGKEYLMNWSLECFTKPTVALMDGMVMGSGAGLTLYGTHRVASQNFSFGMPEAAIGFFPDVGVCSVLANLPGNIGIYLGLTGRSISRAMAYRLNLVTHCIGAEHFEHIVARLADADPVDPIVDELHETPEETDDLLSHAQTLDEMFGEPTVQGVFDALALRASRTGPDGEWCAGVLQDLNARCPISLAVTFRHLKECRGLSLRQVLIRDYRIASQFLIGKDFQEGVRAVLIDKDHTPNWSHSSVNEVSEGEIEEYFAGGKIPDLELPEREKVQEKRG